MAPLSCTVVNAAGNGESSTPGSAPSYTVPDARIVDIEHPCIIKNVDSSIKSLGGPERLDEFLSIETPAHLKSTGASLRPDDAFAKPIPSRYCHANEVLLRVTVPKRTARKRKRASAHSSSHERDESRHPGSATNSPKDLLRSMRDNIDRYAVEVVGQVRESHRFRSIPDSQYATTTVPLVDTLRRSVIHLDQERIRQFRFGPDFGVQPGQDVGPPAHFTPRDTHDVPHVWSYKQNPNVQVIKDRHGKVSHVNSGKVKAHFNHTLEPDAEAVPDGIPSSAELEPEQTLPKRVQDHIKRIRKIMETRPILTKRVINAMLKGSDNDTRYAWAYCGYVFRSGPWRDALIRFGVDPRTDPKYRFYQCFTFKIDKNRFSADGVKQKWQHYGQKTQATAGQTSYEFDGQSLVTDGKVFQACDITDPLLKSIVDTASFRDRYCPGDGWYHNGTLAKLRVIMKHKLDLCVVGKKPDDDFYQRLATFPDDIPSGNAGTLHWREVIATDGRDQPTKEEQQLSESIRTQASAAREKRRIRTHQTRLAEDSVPGGTDDIEADAEDDDAGDGQDVGGESDGGSDNEQVDHEEKDVVDKDDHNTNFYD